MTLGYGGQIATAPVDGKVRAAYETNGVGGGKVGLAHWVVRETGNEGRLRVSGELGLACCRGGGASSMTTRTAADYFRL